MWKIPATTNYCSVNGIREVEVQKQVKSSSKTRNGISFATTIGFNIASAMVDDDFPIDKFKEYILNAARKGGYTDASYTGGWSPYYVQSNVLRQVALALTFFEDKEMLSPGERAEIIKWGMI